MRRRHSKPRLDYRNPFMEVRYTRVEFDGFQKDYYVIELGPRAGIVAIKDECVLLSSQYRFLIDSMSWELPGGKVDPGESPEHAAIRETLEETGIECSALTKLVEYYPGLDNFNNRTTLFVSRDTRAAARFSPSASEVIEIRWVPVAEALQMVKSGLILDALTVAGLLAYKALAT
jgi:8-oxo-dGTP pyrophosphatase MutT (NUDIX family)